MKLFANFLNLVGLLVKCLILCQFLIFELIGALWTFPTKLMCTCLRNSNSAELPRMAKLRNMFGPAKNELTARSIIVNKNRGAVVTAL